MPAAAGQEWRLRAIVLPALVALAGCIPRMGAPDTSPRPAPAAPAPHPSETETSIRTVELPDAGTRSSALLTRRIVPDATTVAPSTYVVAAGDTLGAVGARTGVGAEAIARANGLSPPYALRAGQTLRVPGGRYHRVRSGETGVAIARAYGVPWSDVATLNDLQPPYILRTGQRLLLPSAREVAAMTVEQRADAFRLDIDDLVTGSEPAIPRGAAPAKPAATPGTRLPTNVAVAPPSHFAGRFGWPLDGRLLERFGPSGNGRRNDGIDIAATKGAPVRASADGVVAYAGTAIAVYGGLVLLKHGDGWITAYGHAEDILVARGQSVKRGQIIARAGATGTASRPQLHFEIRDKRTPVDPLRYLPDPA